MQNTQETTDEDDAQHQGSKARKIAQPGVTKLVSIPLSPSKTQLSSVRFDFAASPSGHSTTSWTELPTNPAPRHLSSGE